MQQATLERYFINSVSGPRMGHMNVISDRDNISQCVLTQSKPKKSCSKTSFLEFCDFSKLSMITFGVL